MVLTSKQAAQVAKAPAPQKAVVRANFKAQNASPAAPAKKVQMTPAKPRRMQVANTVKKVKVPNFLDPLSAMASPSVTSDGKALPHTGLVSGDFVVGTTDRSMLVVTNTGHSGTVAILVNVDSAGAPTEGGQLFTIPTLAVSDSEGGASASRAMKFSVSVVNCSNALKRGGRVTYLNSSQRLPSTYTATGTRDYNPVIEAIKSSPYRKRITGDVLGTATHLIGFPVDNTVYNAFSAHHGTLTSEEFWKYVTGASSGFEPSPRPMSIIAFVFDPAGDAQDYSVTVRSSYYTRWPLTSVPGQSMRAMPTADARLINHVRDQAEAKANDLAHVVEGGALAMVAPKVAGAARSAGGKLLSRLGSTLGRGAVTAAEAAEGAAAGILGIDALAAAEAAAVLL